MTYKQKHDRSWSPVAFKHLSNTHQSCCAHAQMFGQTKGKLSGELIEWMDEETQNMRGSHILLEWLHAQIAWLQLQAGR